MGYFYLEKDFEKRLCEVRELFHKKGGSLILGKNEKETIYSYKTKFLFDDVKITGELKFACTIKKIYVEPKSLQKLYRIQISAIYSSPELDKKVPFSFCMALKPKFS